MVSFKILALMACIGLCLGGPRKYLTSNNLKDVYAYLQRFGYIAAEDEPDKPTEDLLGAAEDEPDKPTEDLLEGPLRIFQQRTGLPITGKLDDATLNLMNTPRCGMNDSLPVGRYGTYSKWPKKSLTFRLNNKASSLSEADTRRDVLRAFKKWSCVADVLLTETTSDADIEVHFVKGDHGDGYPFDGAGNIVSHTWYPHETQEYALEGDIHFDDDETFTVDSSSGINMFFLALHEAGHSLGLTHSGVSGAIMYPYIQAYNANMELHADDIAGVRSLYGAAKK